MLFCSCDRSRVKLKFYEKLWGGGGGGGVVCSLNRPNMLFL